MPRKPLIGAEEISYVMGCRHSVASTHDDTTDVARSLSKRQSYGNLLRAQFGFNEGSTACDT